MLVKTGADLDAVDSTSKTPLYTPAAGDFHEIAGAMIHLGADSRIIDEQGFTALQIAEKHDSKRVEALLRG